MPTTLEPTINRINFSIVLYLLFNKFSLRSIHPTAASNNGNINKKYTTTNRRGHTKTKKGDTMPVKKCVQEYHQSYSYTHNFAKANGNNKKFNHQGNF